jgi:hypothetical protein
MWLLCCCAWLPKTTSLALDPQVVFLNVTLWPCSPLPRWVHLRSRGSCWQARPAGALPQQTHQALACHWQPASVICSTQAQFCRTDAQTAAEVTTPIVAVPVAQRGLKHIRRRLAIGYWHMPQAFPAPCRQPQTEARTQIAHLITTHCCLE